MSVAPLDPSRTPSKSSSSFGGSPDKPPKRWIISSSIDQLLIIWTPLLVIPAVLALRSPLGVKAETISLVVTAFFALGHHLPGLIRAYGDRELFERFKWRFLLAPPLLFIAYFPLQFHHPEIYRLIITFWATWHGLMQLYGFVRIYDAKVGSISSTTAYWDWLVCLLGFVTVHFFSPVKMTNLLDDWYSFGGPVIPPVAIQGCRWVLLSALITVSIGFALNYVTQWKRGPKPNPVKLLLLASGIGTWWFAVAYIRNIILGVALFDICHDVQYLAIVWFYNCSRVKSNPNVGRFMSYLFRRGMVLLYVGLIAAYGAIGLIPSLVQDGTVITVFNGILGTSTLLHYYYDGFIWKVREKSTQASLGLNQNSATALVRQMSGGGLVHLLKWSPLVVLIGWIFSADLMDKSLPLSRKEELRSRYTQTLTERAALPASDDERSWLYEQFVRAQSTAASVPDDPNAQLRAAVMLANFGRNDEAISAVEKLLKQQPDLSDGELVLGSIHLYRGNLDLAGKWLQSAFSHAATEQQRSIANLKLGELSLRLNDSISAESRFHEALKDNPNLRQSIESLRKSIATSTPSP